MNEVFLCVELLRRLAPNRNSPTVGLTHLAVQTFFLTLIGYCNAVVLRRSPTKRGARPDGSAESFSGRRVASSEQD